MKITLHFSKYSYNSIKAIEQQTTVSFGEERIFILLEPRED
jgi:hypothetical protein